LACRDGSCQGCGCISLYIDSFVYSSMSL
jgi:hypothetical protein